MQEILLLFKTVDFSLIGIELVAVTFSLIYVILAAKRNIYCWIAAIISVSAYIYICFCSKLFAETGLQIFYLLMAFYGYYNWNKSTNNTIATWSVNKHLLLILIGSFLTFIMGYYLTIYTEAEMPIIDSFTTIFSILATYMIAKKILENWLYWIVIDIVSIYIYYNKDLYLSSLLFITYTIIAFFGYISWLKTKK